MNALRQHVLAAVDAAEKYDLWLDANTALAIAKITQQIEKGGSEHAARRSEVRGDYA